MDSPDTTTMDRRLLLALALLALALLALALLAGPAGASQAKPQGVPPAAAAPAAAHVPVQLALAPSGSLHTEARPRPVPVTSREPARWTSLDVCSLPWP